MYRKISAVVIPTLLAFGIIAWMLFNVWDQFIDALQHLVPAYLAGAIIICLAAWLIRGWRYRTILNSLGHSVGVLVATACIFVSQTVNLIVLARIGDFVRVFILKHEYNTTYSEGVSSLVVERVFDIFTIALLGAFSVMFVLNVPSWFYAVIILPLVAGVLFFIFLLCIGKLSTRNKYIGILLTMLQEIRTASLSLKSLLLVGGSSIIIWLLDIFICFAVVLMFGQQIEFAVVVLAIVIGNLVKAVPFTPGGIGAYEAVVAATLALGGVPLETAAIIAITDHLIKNLVTLAGGIVSVYYFGDWVIPSIKEALNKKLGGGTPSES